MEAIDIACLNRKNNCATKNRKTKPNGDKHVYKLISYVNFLVDKEFLMISRSEKSCCANVSIDLCCVKYVSKEES